MSESVFVRVTGYLAMRVGKTVALALGGGIILLEIANEKGYIKINWSKITDKVDKVSEVVDEKVTGQRPGLMEKVQPLISLITMIGFIKFAQIEI